MDEGNRKRYKAEDKVAVLRRSIIGGEALSEVCTQSGVSPNLFYRWRQELFDNGALVFERAGQRNGNRELRDLQATVTKLQEQLAKKEGVIAQLAQEYVTLKKTLGLA